MEENNQNDFPTQKNPIQEVPSQQVPMQPEIQTQQVPIQPEVPSQPMPAEVLPNNTIVTPAKNNKTIFIIIGVVLLVVIAALIYFLVIKKDNATTPGGKTIQEHINYEDKIKITDESLSSGNILITVKNDNSTSILLQAQVNFYDENNNLIDTEDAYFEPVNPGKSVFEYVRTPNEAFSSYKTNIIKCDKNLIYVDYLKDIETKTKDTGDKLLVEVTNNSNKDIEVVDLFAFFYKDDKLVGISNSNMPVKANGTVTVTIYYPSNKKYSDIKFDRSEVVAQAAYSMEFNY